MHAFETSAVYHVIVFFFFQLIAAAQNGFECQNFVHVGGQISRVLSKLEVTHFAQS